MPYYPTFMMKVNHRAHTPNRALLSQEARHV
jgi:hypothetical protein